MEEYDYINDQMLGAFVDNQLDVANSAAVLKAMEENPEIRETVYQLRRAKDMMKLGFGDAHAPTRPLPKARFPSLRRCSTALAASIVALAVSLGAGVFGYYCGNKANTGIVPAIVAAKQTASDRVVLHISESDPKQFAAALAYTEKFLEEQEARGSQIEVVANSGGLDLMRAGVTPFEQRVLDMISKHDNVHFIACANAIRNLRKQGIEPIIIKDVETDKTAIDHIIGRLRAGWTYIKVDSLMGT